MPDDVTTRHPEYAARLDQWKRCRDFRAGRDEVLGGSYLMQPLGMENDQFLFYKSRAQYLNAMGRTIQSLSGTLLRTDPVVENFPKKFDDHLIDLTQKDEGAFPAVAGNLSVEVLTVGRVGVLLDMPPKGAKRPHWVMILAEGITNWRTKRVGDDPSKLTMLVIAEDVPDPTDNYFDDESKTRYRELALDENGLYQVRLWNQVKDTTEYAPAEWMFPLRLGERLDFIPFTFIGPDSITPSVSKPPLIDLVDVSLGHFNNSADYEYGLYLLALPTPWYSGDIKEGPPLKLGPSAAWDLGKDGKAGMLEFSGQGLGALREAMIEKKLQMAALGARLLENPQTGRDETATAVRIRHSGDEAALSFIGSAMSAGLTQLLTRHSWWSDSGEMPTDITVEISDKFLNVRATPEDVKTLVLQLQAEAISYETFYAQLMDGGWAREGVTAEEELQAIRAGGGGKPAELDVADNGEEEDE